MEEDQETYLLSDVTEEGMPTPNTAVSTTDPVPIITASPDAKRSPGQSNLRTIVVDPASGQHGQAIYVTLGPEEQVLHVLDPGLVQTPVKQPALAQDVDTTQQVPGQPTMGTVPLVGQSIAQSPILLVQAPAASQPQAQSNQKGKKGTRRNILTMQRGSSTSSKQTVRSLLQQKSAPASTLANEVVPNIALLSHESPLGEGLQLSASASTSACDSDLKPGNVLSLLSQTKRSTESQGVAMPDLNKFIPTQQTGQQVKPSNLSGKKSTRQAASPSGIVQAKMRPLIPILPAPQSPDMSIADSMFTVPAADAQLIGALPDAPQLLTPPAGLMSLSSDLDRNKEMLGVPQVQYAQSDESSVLPSQEPLLLPPGTTDVPGTASAVDLHAMAQGESGFTAHEDTRPFGASEALSVAEHDEPVICTESQEDLMSQAATGPDFETTQQHQPAAAAEPLSTDIIAAEASEKQAILDPQTSDAITDAGRAEVVASSHLLQTDVGLVPETSAQVKKLQKQQVCKVFSEMKARLSQTLLDAIPGANFAGLLNIARENNLDVLQEDQTFTVSGDIHDLISLHTVCLNFLGTANKCTSLVEQTKLTGGSCDKQTMCELLKPQYSRSGRQLKWQTMDSRYDDLIEASHPESKPKQAKAPRAQKSARTRSSRKAKLKRTEPDVLQQAIEKVLGKGDWDVEDKGADTVTSSGSSPHKGAQQTTKIKAEDHSDSIDDADCSTVLNHTAVDHAASKLDDPAPGKDSEKEKEDEKRTAAIKTEPAHAAHLSENAEGLQLGRKKKHKKNYEKETPFKFFCSKCSFKTIRSSHFHKHMQYHNEDLPLLKCTKCDFKTIRRSHLTKHQMVHSKVKYECPVCKYKSDNRTLLTRHYKAKHKSENTKPRKELTVFSCPHCSYKTVRLYLYNRHLKCHSLPENSVNLTHTYQCDICSYKTQRKEHYCRHKANVHEKKRPHLCDLCGKAFKRKDALKQHKLLHAGTRVCPYKCPHPQCKKAFSSRGHLRDHMTIHSNVRAYLCEICGASFKTSSVQRKHVQTVHTNPRQFPCSKCDKRFNTKYSLRRHLAIHDTPGMRALQDTGNNMMLTETEEVAEVLEQLHVAQDDNVQKIHIIQPQEIIEVGSVVEQSVEGVMEAGQQVVIATASEALAGVHTIEQTYEQVPADGTEQSALVHPTEASAALYYLTSFHSYEN